MFSKRPGWRDSNHWLNSDPDIKCLLLFLDNNHEGEFDIISKNICRDLWQQLNGNVVLAGGHVEYLFGPQEQEPDLVEAESNFMAIAFSGDNVHAASVVISSSIQTAKEAEAVILKLKQASLSEKFSFAFMFACVGRGFYMYREHNVESEIFRKHFPSTPLLGFFGNGEIGHEFLKTREDSAKPRLPRLEHSYSTVFVLVSIDI